MSIFEILSNNIFIYEISQNIMTRKNNSKGYDTMTDETYQSLLEKISLIHKKRRKLNLIEEKLQHQLLQFTTNYKK